MENCLNYYQLLHVQPDAPTEVIKVSFRTLMMTLDHHPDRGGDHQHAAQLNEAYHVLVDEERRREYDRSMAENPSPGQTESPPPVSKRPAGKRSVCTVCPFCKTTLWEAPGAAICSSCGSPLGDAVGPVRFEGYGRTIGRLPREKPLTYYTSWPGPGQEGRLCDLSPGGMRFLGRSAAKPGQIIKINRSPLNATGRVIYCDPNQERGFQYVIGVEIQAIALDTDS